MIDYKEREAAVSADQAYQELEKTAAKAREEASELHSELTRQTYKLQRLLYARDVLLQQMFEQEDLNDDADTILKDLTANSGECWCGMTSQSIEDIQEVIFDLCASITLNRSQHIALEQRRKEAWAAVHERASQVRKEFQAAQEAS